MRRLYLKDFRGRLLVAADYVSNGHFIMPKSALPTRDDTGKRPSFLLREDVKDLASAKAFVDDLTFVGFAKNGTGPSFDPCVTDVACVNQDDVLKGPKGIIGKARGLFRSSGLMARVGNVGLPTVCEAFFDEDGTMKMLDEKYASLFGLEKIWVAESPGCAFDTAGDDWTVAIMLMRTDGTELKKGERALKMAQAARR